MCKIMETLNELKFKKLTDESLSSLAGGWKVLTDSDGKAVAYNYVNERGISVTNVTLEGGFFGFNQDKFKIIND